MSAETLPENESGTDTDDALATALQELSPLLDDPQRKRLVPLVARWREHRFTLLVAGEFKRGKSTLINALIGRPLLPAGMLPVTAVPTRLRAGPRDHAEVVYQRGPREEVPVPELPAYMTENGNPGNRLGVREVLIEVAGIDLPGIEIMDLPGLGSVHAHNTDAALAALPQADLAWLVVAADPPVGAAELTLLKILSSHAARVEVVLNKVDLAADEGAAERLLQYTSDALTGSGHAGIPLWQVAARPALEAAQIRDEVALHRWGMTSLRAHLRQGIRGERESLLRRSVAGKAVRLAAEQRVLLGIELAALSQGHDERHRTLEKFAVLTRERERSWSEAGDLLTRRLSREFEPPFQDAHAIWQAQAGMRFKGVGSGAAAAGDAQRVAAEFLTETAPAVTRRLTDLYGEIADRLADFAARSVGEAWSFAHDVLGVTPPPIELPEIPPPPAAFVPDLYAPRFALDDLIATGQRILPSFLRESLRRLRLRNEADEAVARGLEQLREVCWRRYYGDFRVRLSRFAELGEEVQRRIDRVLTRVVEAEAPEEEPRLAARKEKIAGLEARLARIVEAP